MCMLSGNPYITREEWEERKGTRPNFLGED